MAAKHYKYSPIKHVLITVFVSIIVGFVVYFYKPQDVEFLYNYPLTREVDPSMGLRCEAIIGSMLYGAARHDKKIHGKLFKGTDVLAVNLEGDQEFKLITKASVDVGETDSSENWKVLQNNENFLVATLGKFDDVPLNNYADFFYLNKKSGMGMWIKSSAISFASDTPESQSYLLNCH